MLHLAEEAVEGDGREELLLHQRVLPTLKPAHPTRLTLAPPVKFPKTLVVVTRVIEGGEGGGGGGGGGLCV